MVTLEEYKRHLGKKLDGLSEEEIINRMELQAKFARAFFDSWNRSLKNKTAGVNKIK